MVIAGLPAHKHVAALGGLFGGRRWSSALRKHRDLLFRAQGHERLERIAAPEARGLDCGISMAGPASISISSISSPETTTGSGA
jgi:hypothetical protein